MVSIPFDGGGGGVVPKTRLGNESPEEKIWDDGFSRKRYPFERRFSLLLLKTRRVVSSIPHLTRIVGSTPLFFPGDGEGTPCQTGGCVTRGRLSSLVSPGSKTVLSSDINTETSVSSDTH